MPEDDRARADLLRKFQAALADMEVDEPHQLAQDLFRMGYGFAGRPMRLELRRPPRDETAVYRLRVDLDRAKPPIWRRLDLRSDLPLDVVHQVLQSAFGWDDAHLHRFSLGGGPFDLRSQLFLCPYDVEEGDPGEDGGIAASDVRLDETLHEPGDALRYVYDYGDSWELTLRLEKVLPAISNSPMAVCVGGRRAAPPEDCGGGTTAEELAEVLDDPARFDVDEVNHALRDPYYVLRKYGVDPRLVDVVNRLRHTQAGEDLAARITTLIGEPIEPPTEELRGALAAHLWFLDRANDGGIQLTSAGYLKPADVEAAAAVVPAVGGWIGKNNRESLTAPVLEFRASLQSMGLLRRYKGSLRSTRAGAAARRDPSKLWQHLAAHLVPDQHSDFEATASLLLLAYAGTSPGAPMPWKRTVTALTELGWRHRDGSLLDGRDVYGLDAYTTLINVSDRRAGLGDGDRVSPAAAALARAALRR